MAATAYAESATLFGTGLPKVRNLSQWFPNFGDLALVIFLLAQCFDGVFTYVGVLAYGVGIEANPIVGLLMTHLGAGPGVLSAKVTAGILGIVLHVLQVHLAVALLALFYLAAALTPWMLILFF